MDWRRAFRPPLTPENPRAWLTTSDKWGSSLFTSAQHKAYLCYPMTKAEWLRTVTATKARRRRAAAKTANNAPYLAQLDPRKLVEHPSNLRRTLGDLTELRDSIAASGVLQAQAVVPRTTAAGSSPATAGPQPPPRRSKLASGLRVSRRPCPASSDRT